MRKFKPVKTDGNHLEPQVIFDLKKPWLVLRRVKVTPEFDKEITVELIALESVLDMSYLDGKRGHNNGKNK